MKTSWNDLRASERYLSGQLTTSEREAFESSLAAEPSRYVEFFHFQRLWSVIWLYHRRLLSRDMNRIRAQVNTSDRFTVLRQQLDQIFHS
jgi:anti-sigma factor RsiW